MGYETLQERCLSPHPPQPWRRRKGIKAGRPDKGSHQEQGGKRKHGSQQRREKAINGQGNTPPPARRAGGLQL